MAVTPEQIDEFRQFALEKINNGDADLSLEELVDMWRILHPTPQELDENVLAVKAAIRDMEAGETGRPFEEFAREFRQRNNVPDVCLKR